MRLLRFLPAANSKILLAFLLITCAGLFAPSGRAEDLHFFKNYFVTGDYAVDGVGLYAKGVNGWATGTITPSEVPAGADIVAAFLYWETVESTAAPSSINGFFDFDSNNKPNPIVGDVIGNPQTPPCWSSGGTSGLGIVLRIYRADVLRYLKIDSTNNVRLVDYAHTVTLPDSGLNGNGSTPHTEGASLVVVYRVLQAGAASYKAVVLYDGTYTMTKSSAAFSQTIGGFYDAAGTGAKMTHIVGNGQPGFAATLTVNGNTPKGVSGTPFVGAQGPRWDNLTFAINLALGASSVTTQVTMGGNQVCLSWGAVITSTDVVNTDGDGLLDSWKMNGLHLNVGDSTHPATFGSCKEYPNACEDLHAMGAVLGTKQNPHKDILLQIDWMQGNDGHRHVPKLAALNSIATIFSTHKINVHFDVGSHYQQIPALPYIVPVAYAEGGNLIQESSLECPNAVITNVADCEYNSAGLGYLVLGWKTGIEAIKNGFPILNIPQYFAHDRKDTFHYILFGHALAGLNDPNTGMPATPPPSVSGVGDLFGGDVMLSLGLWRTDDPPNCVQDDLTGVNPNICTDQTGTALVQAGTMMHELGHNLGLSHAGSYQAPNCMPDYPSIMNYLYQTRGLTDALGNEQIDYSSGTLAGLNENSLSETPSLGTLPYRIRYYGPATGFEISTGATAKANCSGTHPPVGTPSVRLETPGVLSSATTIDWNHNGKVDAAQEAVDINFSGTTGDPVQDSVDPTLAAGTAGKRWFIDHNDWANLNLQQIGGRPNVGGLSGDVGPNELSANDQLGQIVLGQNVLGQNVLGQNVLGQSVLGQNVLGQNVLGQNVLGQNVLGQNVLGQNVLGQNVLGEVDYDTAISTLDATGSTTPLVATLTATVPANGYNQITLTWGPPSLGQIRTYNIWRANLDSGSSPMIVGTVSATPLLSFYSFNDVVTDMSASDFGASSNCVSTMCYNTHYQYYITAKDVNNTTSTPSNFVTAIVDHLFVTAFSGSVIYGNTLPNSMAAAISGMPLPGGITSADFTCPTPTPRNVGSYTDTCTGPVVGTPPTVGVTYITGTLTITQRPLTIDAETNTKTYDGTTSALAAPFAPPGTSTSGSGLVNGDTVIGAETYDNRNAGSGKTLSVSTYIVLDGNNGGNYFPITTITNSTGVIAQRPLTIDAVTNAKTYDGSTSADAIPVAAIATGTTGLVNGDSVTGVETYDTRKAGNGKTLSVTSYTVNDGNNGSNYSPVTTATNTTGVINQRPLTIAAVADMKIYDGTTTSSAIPTVVGPTSTTGLVQGDSVTGQVEMYGSPNAGIGTLSVFTYTLSDGNSGHNYNVALLPINGKITQRSLTIDAVTNTKTYDGATSASAIPTVEGAISMSGLVLSDNVTGLVETYGSPNVGTEALSVSVYTVNDGNGGLNYIVTLKPANGMINPAALTATVSESAGPVFAATYTGFVNQEISSVVTGALSCTVGANQVSGNYPISCTGLSASNYNIGYDYSGLSGIAAANPAPLIVNVSGTTQLVSSVPTFTLTSFTYSGFVNGNTSSVVSGMLSCAAEGTIDSGGNYPISCSGLTANNYIITYSYTPGSVGGSPPAPLTVAVNGTQPVGGAPTYTVTYSGFNNGDTVSIVTGTLSCTTDATTSSTAGNYAITSCTGLSVPGTYTISYWLGTVNVM